MTIDYLQAGSPWMVGKCVCRYLARLLAPLTHLFTVFPTRGYGVHLPCMKAPTLSLTYMSGFIHLFITCNPFPHNVIHSKWVYSSLTCPLHALCRSSLVMFLMGPFVLSGVWSMKLVVGSFHSPYEIPA